MKHWFLRKFIYRVTVEQYETILLDKILKDKTHPTPFKLIYKSLVEEPDQWKICEYWVTYEKNSEIRFWISSGRSFFHLDLVDEKFNHNTIRFTRKEMSLLWRLIKMQRARWAQMRLLKLMNAFKKVNPE